MSQSAELSQETFMAMAAQLGLTASPEHLEVLYREVKALLTRMAPIDDVDVSEIPPEEAGFAQDAPSDDGGVA
jgi:hypothetical protein